MPGGNDIPVVFSDRGAWHGYTWGDRGLFDCVSLDSGEHTTIFAGGQVVDREVADDRLTARFSNGARVELYFLDASTAALTVSGPVELTSVGGPFRLQRIDDGYFHHIYVAGPKHGGEDLGGVPRTLRWNWRAPHRDIRSGGAVPSPRTYPGFWAWDSWKHAAVLPARLARQQIQAMIDHQRDDGMIPDTVMPDARRNNWRCTKPPLAAWACSRHPDLLETFRPALLRYHEWWERHRKPPGEELFAYGGDDLEASKWESGWDNATRYDGVELRDGLQSVLSVDLNAYLCLEKRLLGIPDPDLEARVNEVFFHDGAYRDVTWPQHEPVPTLTAASWIPLWCGVADDAKAEQVIERMLDPRHFATPLPFPTVSRSDPKFDPDGYWRGAVWFDHAAWAVEVLLRYGREKEARTAARRLLEAPADWECYNPLTGEPARGPRAACPQFGWTAAARVVLQEIVDGAR